MKKLLIIIFFCISQIANAQDSFLEEAETAMKNRNYDQAIYYIGKALESIKKTHGELSNKYAYALALKTACFYRTDDKDNTVSAALETVKVYDKIHIDSLNAYLYCLGILSRTSAKKSNFKDAILFSTKAAKIIKQRLGEKDPKYENEISSIARLNNKLGNHQEAIRLKTEAVRILKDSLGEKHSSYAYSLGILADFYGDAGNYQEAIRLKTKASAIIKEIYGKTSDKYTTALWEIANYYTESGNEKESVRLKTEILNIHKEELIGLDKSHNSYTSKLGTLAREYRDLGYTKEADQLDAECISIIRKELFGENLQKNTWTNRQTDSSNKQTDYSNNELDKHKKTVRTDTEEKIDEESILDLLRSRISHSYNSLADFHHSHGDYKSAAHYSAEALKNTEKHFDKNHLERIRSLENLAVFNSKLGNAQEAIRYGTEAINMIKELYGENHREYARALGNLAIYNSGLGNYQEAVRLGTKALNINKNISEETDSSRVILLYNQAFYNCSLGNYQEAIELCFEALNICKDLFGTNHPQYATSLNNLALNYSKTDNYQEAVRISTKATNIFSKTLGDHPDFAKSLNNLAYYVGLTGDYKKAIRMGTEAKEMTKKNLGEMHPDYATSLNYLAIWYGKLGYYQKAIKMATEALNIYKKTLGENHPDYAKTLRNLASFYYIYKGDCPEQANLEQEAFVCAKRIILQNMATMTPYEMNNYWKSHNSIIYKHSPKVAYDASLLSKGLLLTAETGINELIQQSGDSKAIAMLENIKTNTLILNKQLEKPINERNLNTDSLSSEIEKERKALAVQSKEFGDFTRYFSTTWQDVRNSLKNNEAAIEFDCGTKYDRWDPAKCTRAMILRKDSKEPELIYLQLDSLKDFKENIMTNWTSIQQKLKGIDSVYFSPAGELYSTPIENLINDGKEYIRVSSTREIVLNHGSAAHTTNSAMRLYGGLAYDMTLDDLTDINEQFKQTADNQRPYYEQRSSRDAVTRSGFKYLRGTLDEVKSIEATAKAYNIQCNAVTGENGTEESLRNISGKKFGILHFATHGFYWTEEDVADKNSDRRLSFLMMNDNTPTHTEDKSMTRSGLIFSGANLALRGIRLPEGMEDGIATAKEISHLDLCGCDLVVLSACQTGLGDISGEGVFGLQRGFRKAGVKSILMSLWEVDDNATQMLMTEFYRNYLKGESKLKSLRKAQDHVKAQPGFEAPEYWAGFILLDGLE